MKGRRETLTLRRPSVGLPLGALVEAHAGWEAFVHTHHPGSSAGAFAFTHHAGRTAVAPPPVRLKTTATPSQATPPRVSVADEGGYIHTYLHTYIHTFIFTYIQTYIQTPIQTPKHPCGAPALSPSSTKNEDFHFPSTHVPFPTPGPLQRRKLKFTWLPVAAAAVPAATPACTSSASSMTA